MYNVCIFYFPINYSIIDYLNPDSTMVVWYQSNCSGFCIFDMSANFQLHIYTTLLLIVISEYVHYELINDISSSYCCITATLPHHFINLSYIRYTMTLI